MAKKIAKTTKKKSAAKRPKVTSRSEKQVKVSVATLSAEHPIRKLLRKLPLLKRLHHEPVTAIPLPSGWQLLVLSWQTVKAQPKLFIGIFIAYIFLVATLVQAGPQGDFASLKDNVGQLFTGHFGAFSQTGPLFVSTFFGAFGQALTNEQITTLSLLNIVFWLAFVAAARFAVEGKKVKVRDILYTAPGPFLPTLIVLLITCLRLAPGILATLLMMQAFNGYIQNWFEGLVWIVIGFPFIILSVYWLVGSAIALVIASLPKVYPLVAFSTAKRLVRGRHFEILKRLLWLVLWIVLLWIVTLLPFILVSLWTNISGIISLVIQLLTQATLVFIVVYFYRLYRGLLK